MMQDFDSLGSEVGQFCISGSSLMGEGWGGAMMLFTAYMEHQVLNRGWLQNMFVNVCECSVGRGYLEV